MSVGALMGVLMLCANAVAPLETGDAKTRCEEIIHVGDSTSVGIKKDLQQWYQYFGFSEITISAGNGRSITRSKPPDQISGLEAVAYYRNNSSRQICWVIALGTNDATSVSTIEQLKRFEKMRETIGDDPSIWVNVSLLSTETRKDNSIRASQWNTILITGHAVIADWNGIALQNKQWFTSDGIHYNATGGRWRALFIASQACAIFQPNQTKCRLFGSTKTNSNKIRNLSTRFAISKY